MMKILCRLLFLFFFFPGVLFASEFSEWSENFPEDNHNMIIERELRYKWYKENKVNVEYDYYNEDRVSNINMEDFIYTKSIETFDEPNSIPYREVTAEPFTVYHGYDRASEILINNFVFHDLIEISEISVYIVINSVEVQIGYRLSDDSIINGDRAKLDDGESGQKSFTVESDTSLTLILNKRYNISDIEVRFYISDSGIYNNTFDISFLRDGRYKVQSKTHTIKAPYTYECRKSGDSLFNHCKMIVKSDASWIKQTAFDDVKYSYVDKLFMYFKLEREYLDDYYAYMDNYIKDEKNYKVYYRYKIIENENNINAEVLCIDNRESNKGIFNEIMKNDNKEKTDKNTLLNINKDNKISLKNEEKVKLLNVKKSSSEKKDSMLFVIIGLFLVIFSIIGRIIFKNNKISRTI